MLALAQALGIAWLWSAAWEGGVGPPRIVCPLRDESVGCGYPGWPCDGLLSRWWVWPVVVLLPLLLVPPRRRAKGAGGRVATSPYRELTLPAPHVLDELAGRHGRAAGRAVVAAAGASWLLIRALPQAVIVALRPLQVQINGVALLDLFVAVVTVLGYVAAARASSGRLPSGCR